MSRTGRRPGASDTREAILAAARQEFAERGFDRATIRGIAANAGVDPALVHHFYETKEKLFATAMRFGVVPSEALGRLSTTRRSRLGETIVRTVLDLWEDDDSRAPFLALLRSAVTNEQAATMLREFVSATALAAIASVADQADAAYRASLVGSQLIGLGIARYVIGIEPLASATSDEVVAAIAPTVQRYLVGRIGGEGSRPTVS